MRIETRWADTRNVYRRRNKPVDMLKKYGLNAETFAE